MFRRPPDNVPPDDMSFFDLPPDASDDALRDALLGLDVPAAAPDFDAKVLAAVHCRSPFWDLAAAYFRPAMATAAASAVITILCLEWPSHMANPAIAAAPPVASSAASARADALRRAIESPLPTYTALSPLRDASEGQKIRKLSHPPGTDIHRTVRP